MTYRTQPGTIPHRALAYLVSLPEGEEVSTAALQEALGINTGNFTSLMRPLISHQMVRAQTNPGHGYGRTLFWSVTAAGRQGAPAPAARPEAPPPPPAARFDSNKTPPAGLTPGGIPRAGDQRRIVESFSRTTHRTPGRGARV